MTDEEFYKLHCELEGAYLKLEYLQQQYRRETGRSFVFGQAFIRRDVTPEEGKMTPEELANKFHNVYERLAPEFGYETRKETRVFSEHTANSQLMIAVCKEILQVLNHDVTKRSSGLEISASLVKTLREKTGVGIMECKKVLKETDGDIEKAVDYLRGTF